MTACSIRRSDPWRIAYNGSWSPGSPNTEKSLAILDAAIAKYGGDPRRVCITGVSVGGAGALQIASAWPDRFSAVVPIATGRAGDLRKLAAKNVPIWSFYNGQDTQSIVHSARRMHRTLLERGASPLSTEFQREGHNAWDSAYGSPALYRWILDQDAANRPEKTYRLLSPAAILAAWQREGTADWQSTGDELKSELSDGRVESRIVSPPMPPGSELHFETFFSLPTRSRLVLIEGDGGE